MKTFKQVHFKVVIYSGTAVAETRKNKVFFCDDIQQQS